MKVKFIGNSFWTQVWKSQMSNRDYKVMKSREFSTGIWNRVEGVFTNKGEWICDIDTDYFKENFKILSE